MLPLQPSLDVYSGRDREEVLAALDAGHQGGEGPARLAIASLTAASPGYATRGAAGAPAADGAGRIIGQAHPDGAGQSHEPGQAHHRRLLARARHWLASGRDRPAGVAYRDTPLRGEIAFVFTNAAAAYPGMGRELGQTFRPTAETVAAAIPGLPFDASGFGRHTMPPDPVEQVLAASLLSAFHSALTRDLLGIRPTAAIGFCTGEISAAHALGVWPDFHGHYQDAHASRIFSEELSGEFHALRQVWKRAGIPGERWTSYWVNAPREQVRSVVDPLPSVHLMSVYGPEACVIGGEVNACREAVLRHFPGRAASPIGFDTAAHVPEVAVVADRLRTLYTRPSVTVPGVRFYSGARTTAFTPTRERMAEAITEQMAGRIDLHATVNNAWAEGARIFIEHGPGAMSTASIKATLGERVHLAVALDAPGRRSLPQFCRALAELTAVGLTLDADRLFAALTPAHYPGQQAGPMADQVV